MASGGARTPSNPAPVSGPGAMSRRTDGGPGQPVRNPGGLPYGENQDLATQQAAAPMAGGPTAGRTSIPPEMAALMGGGATPIGAPSQYPGEPLTTGAPVGPGAGPEVMASGTQIPGPTRTKLLAALKPMMKMAEQPDASPEFRNLVRFLRSQT